MYKAQYSTYLIILIPYVLAPLYAFLTYAFDKVPLKKSIYIGLGTLIWASSMFYISYTNALNYFGSFKTVIVILNVLLSAFLAYKYRFWLTKELHSQWFLVGLQVFRIIGIVFIIETLFGDFPPVFSIPGGIGDLIVGLIAITALLCGLFKNKIPQKMIFILAIAGIIDFISVLFLGVTSSVGYLQLFSFENPNPVYYYPTSLIPLFGVPFALCYHILSLTVLNKDNDIRHKK
jgi:hypothetical protein